jgi:hypothetical protein
MKMEQQVYHGGHIGHRVSVVLIAVALWLCGCESVPRLYPGVILTTAEGAYELDVLWLQTGQEGPGPFIKP